MDGGAWQAAVHGVMKSRTRLRDFTFPFHFHALEKEMATHSSVLAWRIPGRGSLVGCRLWGCTESDTTEATQQQQQQQSYKQTSIHCFKTYNDGKFTASYNCPFYCQTFLVLERSVNRVEMCLSLYPLVMVLPSELNK